MVGSTLIATIGQPETIVKEHTVNTTTTDEYGNPTVTTETTHEIVTVPLDTLVTQAMAPTGEFLLTQCLGVIPRTTTTTTTTTAAAAAAALPDISFDTDGTVPQWQLEAWTRLKLEDMYQNVRTQVRQEGEWLLQSSTWVVIDESVAAHWQTLVHTMQQIVLLSTTTQGSYTAHLEALTLLEQALDYLDLLRTDPTLMEPLRFSLPQFMAVFAPLSLPLFLPHVIGLLREWKRYKKLQHSQG